MSFEIVYAKEPFPKQVVRTIFLAGPTPRGEGESWRKEFLNALEELDYDGHVFVPEPRDGKWEDDYTSQVDWEEEGLKKADCIAFWVPRDIDGTKGTKLPAFTTNDEWGVWKESGKVVWGAPEDVEKVRYQEFYAKKYKVPMASTIEDTAKAALEMTKNSALRKDGETYIPLCIWHKPEFQSWYDSLKAAGNRLDSADLKWAFWSTKRDSLIMYALRVNVFVEKEQRNKENEVVIFRPDIASALLYYPANDVLDTEIVIVKEFRSPVRNQEGFVFELPGGSSTDKMSLKKMVAQEVKEECELSIDESRLKQVSSRQLTSTLSAHVGSVFVVELTEAEINQVKMYEKAGDAFGVSGSSEFTYPTVRTVRSLLYGKDVDWSTIGMIMSTIEYEIGFGNW